MRAFLLCILCLFSSISRCTRRKCYYYYWRLFAVLRACEYIVCTSTIRVKLLIYFMCGWDVHELSMHILHIYICAEGKVSVCCIESSLMMASEEAPRHVCESAFGQRQAMFSLQTPKHMFSQTKAINHVTWMCYNLMPTVHNLRVSIYL